MVREAAPARGKQTGRPRALSADQAALARRMRDAGEPVATIRKTLGVSRSVLYRLLSEETVKANLMRTLTADEVARGARARAGAHPGCRSRACSPILTQCHVA